MVLQGETKAIIVGAALMMRNFEEHGLLQSFMLLLFMRWNQQICPPML
ncbi:hypothetical protein GLW07_13655 [Bacillus hwajinpoensis]|uniref:Uncharacterized protein n=1 Tax=Guptibacillus hwajinpoensis TaxID=208199 RepID=A0A845F0Z7_9BACL|nr:hypothetical protein [Pseudalkalibacillus hwajinpoensis]MYL64397.1 hypothetical protein [Pseudalkalibacillus hwajinpoensis]